MLAQVDSLYLPRPHVQGCPPAWPLLGISLFGILAIGPLAVQLVVAGSGEGHVYVIAWSALSLNVIVMLTLEPALGHQSVLCVEPGDLQCGCWRVCAAPPPV